MGADRPKVQSAWLPPSLSPGNIFPFSYHRATRVFFLFVSDPFSEPLGSFGTWFYRDGVGALVRAWDDY